MSRIHEKGWKIFDDVINHIDRTNFSAEIRFDGIEWYVGLFEMGK